MKFMKRAAAALLLACAGASHAAHVAYLYQNGANVELTGSGPLNTAALTFFASGGFATSEVTPSTGALLYGTARYDIFSGVAGPANFGVGVPVFGTSTPGPAIGILGAAGFLMVPRSYVSGSPLSGNLVLTGSTLAGLRATLGTYVWTWGAGPTADSFTLHITAAPPARVTATKTVAGPFSAGSTATYTVVLNNSGPGAQADNPGNEFTDVLPAGVTVVSAVATSGTAVATVGTNTVTWNGSIPAAGTVTLTITTTVNAAPIGTVVSSQGTVSFDSDADGTNDATNATDDPGVGGAADPTNFTIAAAAAAAASIPTLSEWALIALASLMAMFGLARARRH